jgi:antitoxin component YwqK of YwqJK toxin-antitoxin module
MNVMSLRQRCHALIFCVGASWLPLLAAASPPAPVAISALEPGVSETAPIAAEPTAAVLPAASSTPLQTIESAPSPAALPVVKSRLANVRLDEVGTVEVPKHEAPKNAHALPVGLELVQERYRSGALKIEREVTRDHKGALILNGVFRQFDEQGTLLCEGTYEENQPVGVWIRYYVANDAPLFATSPYSDFAGPFMSRANFTEGQLDGKWTISDVKQRTISEIDFVAGQRHGKALWFHPNGTLISQVCFEHGRVHGDAMKWDHDNSLLGKETYIHGRKIAPKVEYYDAENKRSEISYLHAPLDVKTPDNFHTALLATFEQHGQDERFGSFRTWHANGQPAREGEFRYNLPVGNATWFYSNGQKQMEGTYVDGKQAGTWTWWHQNGMKQSTGDYRDGVAVGKWQWWKEDGKLVKTSHLSGKQVADRPSAMIDSDENLLRR